jgi:rubredoxin
VTTLTSPTLNHSATIMKKWQCIFCGFYYDEAAGLPAEGIAAGTRWEDIPDDWACPECGATKADFVMIEVAA